MAPTTPGSGSIAILGDLHSHWDDWDVKYFNHTFYELLLFAGDLGGTVLKDGIRIARSISRLSAPALVMPGNNDVEHHPRFDAELTHQRGLIELLRDSDAPRSSLRRAVGEARTCGYSTHRVDLPEVSVSIVTGRPFAMGKGELSFAPALEKSFGIRRLEGSVARLRSLVDSVETEHVVFFSHNGPAGLGAERDAPWGRDFHADAGDWGDQDLTLAIDHARARGLRVLCVVAGHMHWSLRGGGERRWKAERDGTLYVNSARVPRIFDSDQGPVHQHLSLSLTRDRATVEEIFAYPEG